MQFVSSDEAAEWRQGNGLPELTNMWTYMSELPSCRFAFPKGRGAETWVAAYLALVLPANEERLFEIRQWGIWESSENWHLVARLRLSYGEESSLAEKPGLVVAAGNTEELATFIQIAMISGWDALLLTDWGHSAVQISHDEWFTVRSDDPGLVGSAAADLAVNLKALPTQR